MQTSGHTNLIRLDDFPLAMVAHAHVHGLPPQPSHIDTTTLTLTTNHLDLRYEDSNSDSPALLELRILLTR